MNKLFSKKLVFFVTLLLITLSSSKTTYAAESTSCDNPPAWKKGYCTYVAGTLSFPKINVETTMANAATSLLTNIPSHFTHGRTVDQMQSCITKIMGYSDPGGATPPSTTDDCSDLRNASVITGTNGYPTQFRSSSTIMGLAMALEDIALNDEVPINLAYYAKYQASKIPVLKNTAFAASTPSEENLLLQVTLEIWEVVRDISFGLLALFMLVIGIMIMLRHKVNPQTVVTVQSAIPRIIISIIFIAFSYPIGALAIALINPLSSLGLSLLTPAFESLEATMGGAVPLATAFYWLASLALVTMSGAGIILVIITIVTFLVFLFFLIKVFLTIIMTYVHLIYAILSAPLIFSWGVIPGNEHVIPDWFKRLGVKVITIPLVIFGFRLVWYMTLKIALATTVTSVRSIGGFIGGAGILIVGIPILIIMMLLQLGKLPQKLDELVLGKKK